MNKKNQGFLYIISGIILSTLFLLITDWYDVKIQRLEIHGAWLWLVYIALSAPFLFFGFRKLFRTIIVSCLLTILILFILIPVDIVLLLNFHLWIGGHL